MPQLRPGCSRPVGYSRTNPGSWSNPVRCGPAAFAPKGFVHEADASGHLGAATEDWSDPVADILPGTNQDLFALVCSFAHLR